MCCMVQRDVLGLTRGAVPILARSGVDALTVGCNGAGAPPGVPKNQPFLWRDEGSGTQIIAMWHAGLHLPQELAQLLKGTSPCRDKLMAMI